jgi:polysaccharide biosynthesis protein VpsQ
MKRLAVLFTLFLIIVIVLADLGYMRRVLWLLDAIPYGDKVMHFLLVGTLNFLITSSLIQTLPAWNSKLVALTVGLCIAMIFTIEEISQEFFRGRDATLNDLLANYAGIIFFGFVAWFYKQKWKP